MKNPIIKELKNLKLVSKSSIVLLKNKTRDYKIKVFKDLKSKIIFLDEFITNDKYYSSAKKYDFTKSKNKKIRIDNIRTMDGSVKTAMIRTMNGSVKTSMVDDNYRRVSQFKSILKNKNILDFGCAYGGFLMNLKNHKSLSGVELQKKCINYIKRKNKKINIKSDINLLNQKFDVITMFHVLEHIPYQVDILKKLKSKLNKKGKIIIEVPHAEDFLILQDELDEFKNFTFWGEHLVLHTAKSLKKIILKAGFKKVKIQYYQRYNLANHLGWLIKRKPGGHIFYKDKVDEQLNKSYCKNLEKLGQTDTLIAIAE